MSQWIKYFGFLLLGAFLMVPGLPGNSDRVWASEQGVLNENTPGSGDLRIENGKVTGQFKQWPVSKVLDSLLGPMAIEYHVREELLDHPVSATLDQVPLNDALHAVLDPFNYLVLTGAGQNIKSLHILGLKSGLPVGLPGPQESITTQAPSPFESEPSPVTKNVELRAFEKNLREALNKAREAFNKALEKKKAQALESGDPETDHQDQPTESGYLALDEVELTEEQRQAFDVAGQKIGQLSEEEMKRFFPSQPSVEEGQPPESGTANPVPGFSFGGNDEFFPPQKPLLDEILESFQRDSR